MRAPTDNGNALLSLMRFSIRSVSACLISVLFLGWFNLSARADGQDAQGKFLEKFQQKRRNVATYQADFTQKKTLSLFGEEKVSSGEVLFKTPHRMIWKYQRPDRTEMLVTDKAVSFYFPSLNQIEVYKMTDGKGAAPFFFAFEATADQITENFSLVGPVDEGGLERIDLTPTKDPLASEVKTVVLWLSNKDYLPRKILINELSGDTTEITLSHARINKAIADEQLDFNAPKGTEIIEESSGL